MIKTTIICDSCKKELKEPNIYLIDIKPYISVSSPIMQTLTPFPNKHICCGCLSKIFPEYSLTSQK